MTAAPVTRVLKALDAPRTDARFVGGAVRNAVMGLPVGEIDLATTDLPATVTQRLQNAGIKAVPTGIDHGTVMAVADGETFEITTLRRDTACDGRHAAVEFTTDWHEDARRRDFTFNAMSLRPDGTLFDDHGGAEDAIAGRVRFVGVPADRIQEDYLRILRLFRFFAWYGRAPLDDETLTACRVHAVRLAQLSSERIRQEVQKLLSAPAPQSAVQTMIDVGVLHHALPEPHAFDVFVRLAALESQHTLDPGDWLRRLAALAPSATVADRLKLSNAERERFTAMLCETPRVDDHADPSALRRALYRLGGPLVRDRILLAWAKADDAQIPPWRALLDASETWTPKTLPVSGRDVLDLGLAPGPDVGRLLATVEAWWIGAGFAPSRDEALSHLRHLASAKNKDGSGGAPEPSGL
jgi:poly(A) polymerase